MKKYQQLLLAILSVFSFSCLLIYRHEYNKLRYVLEVLNFFGSPGPSTLRPPGCIQNIIYSGYSVPEASLSAWQRISNSLYIYSAYWEKVNNKEHVKAYAVGVLNENLNYGCYLWYDSNPKVKSGQFSFSEIAYKSFDSGNNKSFAKSKIKAFVFYCETEGEGFIPAGVSFYKTNVNETSQGYLPVTSLKTGSPVENSIAICLMPTALPMYNKSDYLEFLSFHQILGIKNFYIYGANNQQNLLSHIQRIFPSEVQLNILLWNFPFFNDTKLMKVVAENDCKTRAGLFENVVILDWNKYLVPMDFLNISKILKELDHDKKTYKFLLPTLLFCTEYKDNVNSNLTLPIVLRKTKFSLPKFDSPVTAFRSNLKTGQVQKISKNIISVHHYTSCKDYKIKSKDKISDKVDSSMHFFKKLLHSKLLNSFNFVN